MWIVRIALKKPYTFVVMSILIAILGIVTISRMPMDIFPEIQIPVVAVIWNYTGISPDEMETRVARRHERHPVDAVRYANNHQRSLVDGIDHVYRCGNGQLDFAGDIRQGSTTRGTEFD